ncbi:hypothetical protein WA158_006823 [Blastocystis sp. Blastoise]
MGKKILIVSKTAGVASRETLVFLNSTFYSPISFAGTLTYMYIYTRDIYDDGYCLDNRRDKYKVYIKGDGDYTQKSFYSFSTSPSLDIYTQEYQYTSICPLYTFIQLPSKVRNITVKIDCLSEDNIWSSLEWNITTIPSTEITSTIQVTHDSLYTAGNIISINIKFFDIYNNSVINLQSVYKICDYSYVEDRNTYYDVMNPDSISLLSTCSITAKVSGFHKISLITLVSGNIYDSYLTVVPGTLYIAHTDIHGTGIEFVSYCDSTNISICGDIYMNLKDEYFNSLNATYYIEEGGYSKEDPSFSIYNHEGEYIDIDIRRADTLEDTPFTVDKHILNNTIHIHYIVEMSSIIGLTESEYPYLYIRLFFQNKQDNLFSKDIPITLSSLPYSLFILTSPLVFHVSSILNVNLETDPFFSFQIFDENQHIITGQQSNLKWINIDEDYYDGIMYIVETTSPVTITTWTCLKYSLSSTYSGTFSMGFVPEIRRELDVIVKDIHNNEIPIPLNQQFNLTSSPPLLYSYTLNNNHIHFLIDSPLHLSSYRDLYTITISTSFEDQPYIEILTTTTYAYPNMNLLGSPSYLLCPDELTTGIEFNCTFHPRDIYGNDINPTYIQPFLKSTLIDSKGNNLNVCDLPYCTGNKPAIFIFDHNTIYTKMYYIDADTYTITFSLEQVHYEQQFQLIISPSIMDPQQSFIHFPSNNNPIPVPNYEDYGKNELLDDEGINKTYIAVMQY